MPKKTRLDLLLVERGLSPSRSKAAAMIMAGEVTVDGRITDKAGMSVASNAHIRLKDKPRFVSRGGIKLEAALTRFDIDVKEKICADVGASTGGFTDCLLQRGATRVYAIDVGAGILDYRLRVDPRVRLLENTNARYLAQLDEAMDIVAIDVSFISLRLILPTAKAWGAKASHIVALIKPQFEAGKADVGKKGIVTDPAVHRRVLNEISDFAKSQGFAIIDLMRSPIKGQKGNTEFFIWLTTGENVGSSPDFSATIRRLTESKI